MINEKITDGLAVTDRRDRLQVCKPLLTATVTWFVQFVQAKLVEVGTGAAGQFGREATAAAFFRSQLLTTDQYHLERNAFV